MEKNGLNEKEIFIKPQPKMKNNTNIIAAPNKITYNDEKFEKFENTKISLNKKRESQNFPHNENNCNLIFIESIKEL